MFEIPHQTSLEYFQPSETCLLSTPKASSFCSPQEMFGKKTPYPPKYPTSEGIYLEIPINLIELLKFLLGNFFCEPPRISPKSQISSRYIIHSPLPSAATYLSTLIRENMEPSCKCGMK